MREVLERITGAAPLRPRSIRSQIDDEVETIVLKCLAKERDRRYQTAGELARDIRHYLADEPIEAKRDSVAYVLRKHLRRYRLPLAISAAFLLVVVAGLVASLTFWGQSVGERDKAELARQFADQQRRIAEAEAAKAGAVNAFLQDMLAAVDPAGPMGRDVTVREVLDQAAREIDAGSLIHQPELESAVRLTIGRMYAELGLYAAAEPHLRTALGIRERLPGGRIAVAECLSQLGQLLRSAGKFDEAGRLCEQALQIRSDVLGPGNIAVADSLNDVATVLAAQGEYDKAESPFREALAIYRESPDDQRAQIAVVLTQLADLMNRRGDYTAAEPLYREALETRRRVLGEDHLHVAGSLNNLAVLLLEQQRFGRGRRAVA